MATNRWLYCGADLSFRTSHMLDPESVISGAIPAVSPLAVQRLWSLQAQLPPESRGAVSFSAKLIAQICEPDSSDPIAVWARFALIGILLQQGLLEKWREHDSLHNSVFEAAAVFPLPNGLQGVNADDLVNTLPRI